MISSRYCVPIIKAVSIEQAAYAFYMRECWLQCQDGIENSMRILAELTDYEDFDAKLIIRSPVYECFFETDAFKIINAIREYTENECVARMFDIKKLGYDKVCKPYEKYLKDFKDSGLYELKEAKYEG